MPVVTKEQLKIWFSNFKKPPEGEFWAWLDSFRHILDKVPLDDVDGLKVVLSKKADLVNGVVPEDQLPFSVVTSEVITLGSVELIDTKTYLRLHSSGANKVRVKGKLITRTFQNQWTITPIGADGVKVLRGYAVKNNDDFLLAEGAELPNYVEPEIPEDALEIFKITMRSSGNVIEQTETGLKYIAEDGWRNILLTEELTVLPYNFDLKSSYWINSRVANPVIGGIHNGVIDRNASPTWDGKEFWLFNNTGGDLLLDPSNVTAIDVYLFSDKLMPLTIKKSNAVLLKLKDNVIEIMQGGGGGASFPVSGGDGDVLVKSGTSALWSSIIKGVEFLGNAWLKLKLISFQGYTIAQKNAIASPVEGMLIYQNESPKGFQKYENGAWAAIGSNISNADLSNVSARTFTQGNTFTWDTLGQLLWFKGNVKIDAITLPNNAITTGSSRLRNDNNRLKFVDGLGVEKDIAYLTDLTTRTLMTITHSGQQEIYISAIDYATGYVTTSVPHGIVIGYGVIVGLFTNDFAVNNSRVHNARAIPFEYRTNLMYLRVIDANTVSLRSALNTVVSVNPTSFPNNGMLDISKWHIEMYTPFMASLPQGYKRLEFQIYGMGGAYANNQRDIVMNLYDEAGTGEIYSPIYIPNGFTPNASKNAVIFTTSLSVNTTNNMLSKVGYENSYGGQDDNASYSNFNMTLGGSSLIAKNRGIKNFGLAGVANGSIITVYL